MIPHPHAWRLYLRCIFLLFGLSACGQGFSCDPEGEPFPFKDRLYSAVQLRVSEGGLDFLEENLQPLLSQALPDDLSFCIEGQGGRTIGIDWGFCDTERCDNGALGCSVNIALGEIDLQPLPAPERAPGVPEDRRGIIRATVEFDTLEAAFQVHANPIADCTLSISAPGFPVSVDLDLRTPDPTRDLSFQLREPRYRLADLSIRLRGNGGFLSPVCNIIDGVINFPIIGDLIFDTLQGFIDGFLIDTLAGLLDDFTCRSCTQASDCPQLPGVRCQSGRCMSGDQCLPLPLGAEGGLDLGSLLSGISPGLEARLQYLASAGSYVQVEQRGLSLGAVTGVTSERNRCVPARPAPSEHEAPRAEALRGNVAPNGEAYEVGFGVSELLLEHAFWGIFNSGLLCIEVSGEQISQLSTQFLSLPLPSLRTLARGSAPMAITLSPQEVPQFEIGANTVAGPNADGAYTLDDPLLTVTLPEVWIDFHLWMEDRWTRVFSLRTDLVLPLGIAFTPDNGLMPLLGNLSAAIQNLEAHNGEILLDNPSRLTALLPALIGPLLNGFTDGLIGAIQLPDIMGYQLDLRRSYLAGIEDNTFIGLFAGLSRTDAPLPADPDDPGLPDSPAPAPQLNTQVSLLALDVPPTAEFEEHGDGSWRKVGVTLALAAEGLPPGLAEYSVKVDDHSWSLFSPEPVQTVRSPAFALQGRHRIQVRARHIDDYRSLDPTPAELEVIIDSMAPELEVTRSAGRLHLDLSDWVSPAQAIERFVRFDDEPEWRRFEGTQLDLPPEARTMQLRVVDEAGNATEQALKLGADRLELIGRLPPDQRGDAGGCGCDVGAQPREGAPSGLLWLALLCLWPRRRAGGRWAPVALGLLAFWGCDDAAPGGDKGQDDSGIATEPDADTPEPVCPPCAEHEICQEGACATISCADDAQACDALDCGQGRAALCTAEGLCACEPFCAAGCAEGEFCCEADNRCQTPEPPTCPPMECPAGYEGALLDGGEPNPASCQLEGVECGCVEQAPIELGPIGRYSALAVRGEVAWVSAYAEQYGDLVVGRYTEAEGFSWDFVDGLPESGTPEGAPSGPRGGLTAPGENVGTHTGIAVSADGHVHVVYRDESARALKYALGSPEAEGYSWQTQVLDAEGDPGRWASISLNQHGLPSVAYQVLSVSVEGVAHSQVRWLEARSERPIGLSAWEPPLIVDSQALPPGPPLASGTYPEGIGLFLSQARDPDGLAVLAWYDRTGGSLWSSRFVGAGFSQPELLAGWAHPERVGDMGANVDLFVDPQGNRHLCYQDGLRDTLRYLSPELGVDEEIDDGARYGEGGRGYALHIVGEDCNMRLDAQGNPLIIYQDATGHQLLLARGSTHDAGWLRQPLRGGTPNYDAAFGFYARAQIEAGMLWISHYVYAHEDSPARQYLEILKRAL